VPRRHRVLPRSVIGIAALVLAFAVGAGFSGVVLYSYYQYRLNQTNDRVNTLINGYQKAFKNAEGDLQAQSNADAAQVHAQLAPLQQIEAVPQTLANLVKKLGPSVLFVHTLDASGQPSVGTAFVVSSNANQSLLLTSYTTVAAATRAPAPPVFVRQNNVDTEVTVSTWDPQYDLALLVLQRGGLPPVTPAPTTPAPQLGNQIFALSGLGSAGASISGGVVTDVSASGVADNAPINASYQGGPLVNAEGQVIAVASQTYAPLGFPASGVWYAPYVQAACNKVLHCPSGALPGAG
jgi:S1-C subfamily serine protease